MAEIAAAVHDPEWITGIRPEGLIRVAWVDIDRKPGSVSPYWHPHGQSVEVEALELIAERHGCTVTRLISSESGGLHLAVALPEAIAVWRAHWVLKALTSKAGMEEGAGRCELFPSRLAYCKSERPADWAQSQGIRLPGQQGSALLVGDRRPSDPELIYAELQEALEATTASPGWEALKAEAEALRRASWGAHSAIRRRAMERGCGVTWSGSGESNRNLLQITTWVRLAHPEAETVDALADLIEAAAMAAPGFERWASAETKRSFRNGRARQLATSSLKSWVSCSGQRPAGDPDHNRRRREASLQKLQQAFQELGEKAIGCSQRALQRLAGLSRRTVQKLWQAWLEITGQSAVTEAAAIREDQWTEEKEQNPVQDRDQAGCSEVAYTPCIRGGSAELCVRGLEHSSPDEEVAITDSPLDFGPEILKTAVLISPATSAEQETVGVPVEASPKTLATTAEKDVSLKLAAATVDPVLAMLEQKRQRERLEMEQWIAQQAAADPAPPAGRRRRWWPVEGRPAP